MIAVDDQADSRVPPAPGAAAAVALGAHAGRRKPRWWLALTVGTLLAVAVNVYVFASDYVYVSSRLTFAYMPMGLMLPFTLFMMVVVPLVRALAPRGAFTRDELIVVFAMALVGSVFPTLSMVGFIPSMLATPYYYATPENLWVDLLLPHLPRWAFPPGEGGSMKWFFQGMPADESIPWGAWAMPLFWWTMLLVGIATATFCMTVILRKQWVERERLAFPLAQVPLEMTRLGKGRVPAFLRNKLFWIGLGIPLLATAWNIVQFFEPTFPIFPIFHGAHRIYIGRGFPSLSMKVNILVMGFAFLTPLDVLFSVWFFNWLAIVQVGVQNQLGWSIGPAGIWCGLGSPITAWQSQGAFLVFVALSLWMARAHLWDVLRKAWNPRCAVDDSHEPLSYRAAVVGLLLGLVLVGAWMHRMGMNGLTVVVFGIGFGAVYLGIGKIVAQCGLPYVRATIPPHSFVSYTLGSQAIGPAGLIALASTFAVWCDNKPVLATSMMHTQRVGTEMKSRTHVLTGATVLSMVVCFALAVYLTIAICYRKGGVTTGCWEIVGGNRWFFDKYVQKIHNPEGPHWARLRCMGIGAGIMSGLTFLKYRFAWWPLHPVGFAIGGGGAVSWCSFTLFLTWLIKAILLKVGGIMLFRKARPFFLGLLLGYVLGIGLGFLVDVLWFPAHGHMLHHW